MSRQGPALRPYFSGIAFVVYTVVGSILSIFGGLFDRTGDVVVALGRLWSRCVLATAGVRVRVKSHATLDPKQPYVVMANHLSAVDIWAVFLAVPVPLRFIAKKQLGQI